MVEGLGEEKAERDLMKFFQGLMSWSGRVSVEGGGRVGACKVIALHE